MDPQNTPTQQPNETPPVGPEPPVQPTNDVPSTNVSIPPTPSPQPQPTSVEPNQVDQPVAPQAVASTTNPAPVEAVKSAKKGQGLLIAMVGVVLLLLAVIAFFAFS